MLLAPAKCAAAIVALALSPAMVVFGVPFVLGIVSDVVAAAGSLLCQLALEGAAGLLLWRCLARQRRIYAAPKSMT